MAASLRAAVARERSDAYIAARKLPISWRPISDGFRSRRLTPRSAAMCAISWLMSLSYARTVCAETLRLSWRNSRNCLRSSVTGHPPIQIGQRAFGEREVPGFFAARRARQRLDDPERDVGRLVMRRIGV